MKLSIRNLTRASFCWMLILLNSGCSDGGTEPEADLGGGACSALVARSTDGNEQVFNGETCNQTARTPVVAIFPILANGDQFFVAGACTGTLVTVDDVLTSAHCFTDPLLTFGDSIATFVVVVGGAEGEAIRISNLAIHPQYDGTVGSRFDIAMATLSRVPSPPIGPLPILISRFTLPGQEMSTFGYGTSNRGEIGVLKSAELLIRDVRNGNLIASFSNDGASICAGDSGGPVVQVADGVATIVGVNSFGFFRDGGECPETPALFSGFVDLQSEPILDFIGSYAPDVPFR